MLAGSPQIALLACMPPMTAASTHPASRPVFNQSPARKQVGEARLIGMQVGNGWYRPTTTRSARKGRYCARSTDYRNAKCPIHLPDRPSPCPWKSLGTGMRPQRLDLRLQLMDRGRFDQLGGNAPETRDRQAADTHRAPAHCRSTQCFLVRRLTARFPCTTVDSSMPRYRTAR